MTQIDDRGDGGARALEPGQALRRRGRAFRAQEGVDVDIVIVDNGSSADQLTVLRTIDDVTVLELGENTGFGPGANAGWRHWLARDARRLVCRRAARRAAGAGLPRPDAGGGPRSTLGRPGLRRRR